MGSDGMTIVLLMKQEEVSIPSKAGHGFGPQFAIPHRLRRFVSIPSKAGHGFGQASWYRPKPKHEVSIPSKAGHGFGPKWPNALGQTAGRFQSPQRRGMGSDWVPAPS